MSALEQRNLRAIEMINKDNIRDIEKTRDIYLATISQHSRQASDESGLPPLVDISECTSEQVSPEIFSVG